MAGKIWVMDREAYAERRAILELNGASGLDASRDAADYAYHTRLSVVATAAVNGDWEPAREWCSQAAERFGQDIADQLIEEIDSSIEAVMVWRRR